MLFLAFLYPDYIRIYQKKQLQKELWSYLMDLVQVMERFPYQEACIQHLEDTRWGNKTLCPKCNAEDIVRKNKQGEGRIGRWCCNECKASFKVTSRTIFHGTKIPLQKWFLAISLIANAKKGLSSCQFTRDLCLKQKTTWRIMMKIRTEMAKESPVLTGIIETD